MLLGSQSGHRRSGKMTNIVVRDSINNLEYIFDLKTERNVHLNVVLMGAYRDGF